MQKSLSLFLLVLCSLTMAAQNKKATVSGTVKGPNGVPAASANIVVLDNLAVGTRTNETGNYSITIPAGIPVRIVFSSVDLKADTVTFTLADGETKQHNMSLKARDYVIPTVEVKDKISFADSIEQVLRDQGGIVRIPVEESSFLPSASGGDISSLLLVTGLGVGTVGGELSTSYTVRGGNFDENLVYVNDFEVYRPFLIRSGQQEGLSFVNPDMVGNMTFSSGGFQAKYGDKMASVLDSEYKKPKKFGGSVGIGLLGGSVSLEGIINARKDSARYAQDSIPRATYLFGVRQKSSQYILNSQETKGEYSPSFTDAQGFITVPINKKLSLEWIGNYARNKFSFIPTDRSTTFGVVNNVLRLTIYFDGQERDQYENWMSGLSLLQKVNDHLKFKWMVSGYYAKEEETYDIRGEYYLDAVESDLGSSKFGQTKYNLGVGALQDFARNELVSTVLNAEHRGTFTKVRNHTMSWGLKYQHEIIKDKLHEWQELDSAGYSLPYTGTSVNLSKYLDTKFDLNSERISGFFQDSWRVSKEYGVTFTYGARFSYWSVNKELVPSARAQISIKPPSFIRPGRDVVFTASLGMYSQPPFYREMRDLSGNVNTNLKAQKSIHAILGANYNFKLWKRKFTFIAEAYYKYMYDLVPYEFDNVLIRYFGQNEAKGYTAGLDLRLNGEFVKGTDSYINLSLLKTMEDLKGDSYTYGIDKNGNTVSATSPDAVKHATGYPGYIPRPTDQTVRFTMFFQDYIPKNDNFKMHLNLVVATGLPFGPPNHERFRDTLRIPPYRRLDIGFSALLFSKDRRVAHHKQVKTFMKYMKSIWATFEVYNLIGVNNTVSYIWVRDIHETVYAVPNYLSARRFNLRFVFAF